jgi:hypothetical protein
LVWFSIKNATGIAHARGLMGLGLDQKREYQDGADSFFAMLWQSFLPPTVWHGTQ